MFTRTEELDEICEGLSVQEILVVMRNYDDGSENIGMSNTCGLMRKFAEIILNKENDR